jgi:polysaccharide biosynthesis/export protein VpsN
MSNRTGRLRTIFFACMVFGPVVTPLGAQASRQQGDSISASVRRAAADHPKPGDRVWLHVWREPKLSDTVTVDERGNVLFPKIGLVNAGSLSITSLRDTVRARFGDFYRDAPAEVVVLRRVTVNGSVNKPDVYYVDVSTTLRDVIARAGGVSEQGDDKKVVVVRDGGRVAVPNWQQDNSTVSDLRSGDQVIVGRKSWVAMNLLPIISVSTVVASLIISLARK